MPAVSRAQASRVNSGGGGDLENEQVFTATGEQRLDAGGIGFGAVLVEGVAGAAARVLAEIVGCELVCAAQEFAVLVVLSLQLQRADGEGGGTSDRAIGAVSILYPLRAGCGGVGVAVMDMSGVMEGQAANGGWDVKA